MQKEIIEVKLYMIGLGKMGYRLAENMRDNGHQVVGYDVNEEVVAKFKEEKFEVIESIEELKNIQEKKVIWVMLPAGKITNSTLKKIKDVVANEGDIVIDVGNSDYQYSIKHAEEFEKKGISFLDVGTSGGTYGARNGASFMIGGNENAYKELEEFFKSISVENGTIYTGKSGSGHYLKVIHNAILHSMLEILGEGFDLLNASPFNYNLKDVAFNWKESAVIRGWLMDLAYDAFSKNQKLDDVETVIHSSSACIEAQKSAFELNIPVPMFNITLLMRQRTQQQETFSASVINSLRREIGGYRSKN